MIATQNATPQDHGSNVQQNHACAVVKTVVAEVQLLKSQIHKHVFIKDLGEIQSIFGIEVICDCKAHTISHSHCHYIDKIVAHFGQS